MAISGTGTGPFTITGTETTLTIYNAVVVANAANASKNSDNSSFDFNCVLNVGNGSTVTSWTSEEEHVRIDGSSFAVAANATLTIGSASPARAGGYWRWSCPNDAFAITGTFRAYAARIYCSGRVRVNTGATAYFEECLIAALDSFDNGAGLNPNVQYVRCNVAGATAVGVKLGGTVSLTGTKVSGAAFAYQPLPVTGQIPITYTVRDHVGEGNTSDTVPNGTNTVLNIDGAYELTAGVLVPRTGLISAMHATTNNTVRLRWKYALNSTTNGTGAVGVNVRIRNINNATVFSGQTLANGNIAQQILPRVELINNPTNIPRFPYSVKARRFDLSSEELAWQCDNHTSDKFVHTAKAFTPASEAAGLAIAGVSLVASGASGGTLTVTQPRTTTEIWQYFCAWIAQTANFDSTDTWSFDGTTLNVGAWNMVVNAGATVTGNLTTTGTVTNSGTINGSYTDASGTRVTIKTADNLALSTELFINGVPQGWQTGQSARNIFVGPATQVRIFAIAYGYQPNVINITGDNAGDYVISLTPETNVDTTLDASTRDTIVSTFATGVDAFSRIFLSVSADLRAYTPAQVLNALHRFMVVGGGTVAAAALVQNNVGGFGLMRGGLRIVSPDCYCKVAESVAVPTNLGVLVPLVIGVDPSVYVAMPTYTPVQLNASGVPLQYAPWTQQEADIPGWVAKEVTAAKAASSAALAAALSA